jgi:hypothetical protein
MTFRLRRGKSAKRRGAVAADEWFDTHVDAARQIVAFLEGADLSLEGLEVGDVGTGDGIMPWRLATRLARGASPGGM